MFKSQSPVVGIDLGTTYCCIGVWHKGMVQIVPNGTERTTPSYILFKNNAEPDIGLDAKKAIPSDISQKIYGIKRIIGRKFNDPILMEELKNVSYNVIKGNNQNPLIKVDNNTFSPEELSAKLLEYNLKLAIDMCGCDITEAVITVPANFNDSQREATKNAGEMIGLKKINIITEPNAAAIAYGLNKSIEKTVLIFDFGGGTLDVSILKIKNNFFEVLSTCGDPHFGGEDFDNLLVDYCYNQFQSQNNNFVPFNKIKEVKSKMKNMCEKTKKILSQVDKAKLVIDFLYNRIDLEVEITREKFEDLCKDSFSKCIPIIDKALKESNKKKEEIDEIVLTGGSSMIPKIRNIIKEYFNGKDLNDSINPDEAVAYGATVEAASRFNVFDITLPNLIILDITSFSLGIEIEGEEMSFIIERLSKIPTKVVKEYTNVVDFQKNVLIRVFEGENSNIAQNNELGKFIVNGITPLPKWKNKIDVTFDLDKNGILNVSALDRSSQREGSIKITIDKGRLCRNEIDIKSKEIVTKREMFLEMAKLKFELKELLKKLNEIKINDNTLQIKINERIEEENKFLSQNEKNPNFLKIRTENLKKFYTSLLQKNQSILKPKINSIKTKTENKIIKEYSLD